MKNILLSTFALFLMINTVKAQKKSRLVAQSLYTYNGSKFYLTDTTHYTYYLPYVGGDLNSRYMPYNDAIKYGFDTTLIKLDKLLRTIQGFNTLNHRNEITNYKWNPFLGIWEESNHEIITPNILDSSNTIVQQDWQKSSMTWYNTFKQDYTYDAANNKTSYTIEIWDNPTLSWVNSEKISYTYDLSNNLSKKLFQTWNKTSSSWENVFYDTMVYSATNKQLSLTTLVWLSATSSWRNNRKLSYSYSSSDFLIQVSDQGWDASSGVWYNFQRTNYTNDAKGNNTEWVLQNWDASAAAWNNFRRRISVFDAMDNEINYILQYWVDTSNVFENSEQLTRVFDARNNLIRETAELWNVAKKKWGGTELDEYTYNAYDQLTDYIYYTIWDSATGNYLSNLEDQLFHYYYEEYTTDINEQLREKGTLQLYPVPANSQLSLKLEWEHPQAFELQIVDIQGRIFSEWNVTPSKKYNELISTSNLPSATYFIKIKGYNEGQITRPFTVLH